MTFEEAKKILEKEFAVINLHKSTEPFEFDDSNWFGYEKPSVLEAFRVLSKEGYYITISAHDYDMRKARLKKEYEENTKAPGSAENLIKEDSGVNPALAESATQFNDALLDEQAKKIKSLVKDITHMDNVIYKKNLEIDKQNQEITRLLSLVEKKENSISRLHYEKSVLEKENEELKKGEIPARYFDKALVDEQSEKIKKLEHEKLDILEMASSCKQTIAELTKENERLERVSKTTTDEFNKLYYRMITKSDKIEALGKEIAQLDKIINDKNLKIEELTKEKLNLEDQITVLNACKKHNDKIDRKQIKCLGKEIAKQNSIIHDKNAVLSDVTEELRLSKIREKNLTEVSQRYMKENEELREKVAEKTKLVKMVRNGSKEYCDYGVAANDFIKELAHLYVLASNNGNINGEMLERCKNYQTYGFPANCNRETKKEINDIARGKTKVVGVDIAEEGEDHSGVIVLCRKDFIDAIKKMK